MLDVYNTFSQDEITRYIYSYITWLQVTWLYLLNVIIRIEKLDLLDERILLEQLLQHYTLSCGINDIHNKGITNKRERERV